MCFLVEGFPGLPSGLGRRDSILSVPVNHRDTRQSWAHVCIRGQLALYCECVTLPYSKRCVWLGSNKESLPRKPVCLGESTKFNRTVSW